MLIHEYQESWTEDFHKIKREIHGALVNLNVSIEHIGSTSIPQLAAKPIIDIDVVYDEDVTLEEIKARLEKTGYYHNGDQGIPQREVFKRSKTTQNHEVLDFIDHHLYVCPIDSEELKRHLLFRDYLRANEDARIQYQGLKYKIAEEADQDRKKYAQLKEIKAQTFIAAVLEKAQRP